MNLVELRYFLKQIGRRPNKSLSQNFLIDKNITLKIIATAKVRPGDHILEIGPGPGALTRALLDAGATVFAIEKDPIFAHELLRFQTEDKRLTSLCANFLDFDFNGCSYPMKVVANLPYHITTPILEKLLNRADLFSSFTLMVQEEFAKRIEASPGSKNFNKSALLIQLHTQKNSSFKVTSSCFYPKPHVNSTVFRLDVSLPEVTNIELIQRAFQQRRKMLRTSLGPSETVINILKNIGASPDARPEALSLDQWIKFIKHFV